MPVWRQPWDWHGSATEALVLEQSAAFSEVGAGLQVGPNAVRALRWLGALDAIEPYLFAPPAIRITGRSQPGAN